MDSVRMMFVRTAKSYFREASLVFLGSAVLVSPPALGAAGLPGAVSYTHLTLPTNREV